MKKKKKKLKPEPQINFECDCTCDGCQAIDKEGHCGNEDGGCEGYCDGDLA